MQNRKSLLSILSFAAALGASAAWADTSTPPSGTTDSLPPATSAAPDTAKHDLHFLRRDHDADEHTQNRHLFGLPGQRAADEQEAMHDSNVPVFPPSERDWRKSPN